MRPQERDIAPTTPLGERVSVQAYRYGAVRYGGEKEAEVEIERCKRASEYRQSRQGRGSRGLSFVVVSRRAWRLEIEPCTRRSFQSDGRPIHPGDNLPMNRKPGTYYRAVYRAETLYYYDY